MSQSETDLSKAKLEVVPDAKSGDYLLLADGKPFFFSGLEFRHHSEKLLENIANDWRVRTPIDGFDLTRISYLSLFFASRINPNWESYLFRDPVLHSDSQETSWVSRRLISVLLDKDLTGGFGVLVDEFGRRTEEEEEELDNGFNRLPKDLDRLTAVKRFLEEQGIDHPEVILTWYVPTGRDESELDDNKRKVVFATEEIGGLFLGETSLDETTAESGWGHGLPLDQTLQLAVPEYPEAMNRLLAVVRECLEHLSEEQKNAIFILVMLHSSLMLALLLVMDRCSTSEYALSVLASKAEVMFWGRGHEQTPVQTPTTEEELLEQFGEQDRFNQILGDANITIDYLKLCENPVLELIRRGESKDVEFKSSFRWSLQEGKNSREVQKATLKTIVAFINSGGGTLLLGVSDEGSPVGIEHDNYKNQDTYTRALLSQIRKRIGFEFVDSVEITFSPIGHREVITIKCLPAVPPKYAFLDDELYVRQGPSSELLTGRQLTEFVGGH